MMQCKRMKREEKEQNVTSLSEGKNHSRLIDEQKYLATNLANVLR